MIRFLFLLGILIQSTTYGCKTSNGKSDTKDSGFISKESSKPKGIIWIVDTDQMVHYALCATSNAPLTRSCPNMTETNPAILVSEYRKRLYAAILKKRASADSNAQPDLDSLDELFTKTADLKGQLAVAGIKNSEKVTLTAQLNDLAKQEAAEKTKLGITPSDDSMCVAIIAKLSSGKDVTYAEGDAHYQVALAPFEDNQGTPQDEIPLAPPVVPIESKFVPIAAGSFMMGSPQTEPHHFPQETLHKVTISKPFEIWSTEVTQKQWADIMGTNPSKFNKPENCSGDSTATNAMCPFSPVEMVSWNDVQSYIAALNGKNDGFVYRLPTEAEWEYAARGGTSGPYPGNLDEIGWYADNSNKSTQAVGQKKPNAFGLYDMNGNVGEWVSDWYGPNPSSEQKNPTGDSWGFARAVKGGSWAKPADRCRSAAKDPFGVFFRGSAVGFRVIRTLK